MAGPTSAPASRPAAPARKASTMRPPPPRPGPSRAHTATPTLNGRATPVDSAAPPRSRTPKRKATQEPSDEDVGEETNINVVVRCRGRNEREVRENSGVVVSTDGIKGKRVDLSMGASALSNKTYSFDKVFSPAADQGIIFDEVVTPILDEVLSGFNCTVFAYGQTGTGKTYTMSGDIADVLPLPDGAGIIPRVLHYLFDKLGDDGTNKHESTVKCSFIELYNEELRDLLAFDEGAKLKIYDEANKQGRTTTLVQGMEETYIKNASKGIQLLREGSLKRQVAATKCNDLSSRSHTVFTVTVCMKRTTDSGEDFICSGKLNLVDLAGSENIQRSGAENKRAAEAGLINKSLLTLGRVINALVERSGHIPYRESKLTRLLQDSLGGRTKTCIIATLSPAKSNLEETISTLDYAFRAKNIRNKPQVNQMISKKTLLKEFTVEIEKLKSELIATRQRNGVYLTSENYEEMTTESESRRILSEEQRDRIETLEANYRNKNQELFNLMTSFQTLKRDNEQTCVMLAGSRDTLAKTEINLAQTKRALSEESHLRKAHQDTEAKLTAVGGDLITTVKTTSEHVDRLHASLKRRADAEYHNRERWTDLQSRSNTGADKIHSHIEQFRSRQEGLFLSFGDRMDAFVKCEMEEVQTSRLVLEQSTTAFKHSEVEVTSQNMQAKDNMNEVLEEITTLRDEVKSKVGDGLHDLSAAAQRISAGIASELDTFHGQLQECFVALGREFKSIFEDLAKRMSEQQAEAERLREQLAQANAAFVDASQANQAQFVQTMHEDRQVTAAERAALLAKITGLINDSAVAQDTRIDGHIASANKRIKTSEDEYRVARQAYGSDMDRWSTNGQALMDFAARSKEAVKTKLKTDWSNTEEQTKVLLETTNAVHGETVRIVDVQMAQMDSQLASLDEIVAKTQAQTEKYHVANAASLRQLIGNVEDSYNNIEKHMESAHERRKIQNAEISEQIIDISRDLPGLSNEGVVVKSLQALREDINDTEMTDYKSAGETPAKVQYVYPLVLPSTEHHERLLDRMRGGDGESRERQFNLSLSPIKSPRKRSPTKSHSSPSKPQSSPSKTTIYSDISLSRSTSAATSRPATAIGVSRPLASLKELDVNINTAQTTNLTASDTALDQLSKSTVGPLQKSSNQPPLLMALKSTGRMPLKRSPRLTASSMAEGRENATFSGTSLHSIVGAAAGLSASVGPGGRRLRSHGSD